jgi:hypothetical protein
MVLLYNITQVIILCNVMKIRKCGGNAARMQEQITYPPHVPVEHPPFCLFPLLPLFEEEAGRFGIADERIFIKYITTRYNIYADAI